MRQYFKTSLLILLLCSVLVVGYYSIVHNYGYFLLAELAFLLLFMGYHITADKPRKALFLQTLSFFVVSVLFNIIFMYWARDAIIFTYAVQVALCIGFLLMLREVFRNSTPKHILTRNSWVSFIIVALNVLIIVEVIEFSIDYELGVGHILFGFIFTIIKLLLLSIGLIRVFISEQKSRKITFLTSALGAFFLSDVIDTLNFLFFMENLLPAALVLFSGFFMLGVFMLYLYCTRLKETR